MSYRLIDANSIAEYYPEVNEMDCIYADLPNGLDGEFHIIADKCQLDSLYEEIQNYSIDVDVEAIDSKFVGNTNAYINLGILAELIEKHLGSEE